MIKLTSLLYSLIFCFPSFAYVISKTEAGKDIKWEVDSNELLIFSNPVPVGAKTAGISSSDVMTIFNESLNEWNNYTDFDLTTTYTTSLPSTRNKMFFTSNTSYFGVGVLAVTEISYSVDTGIISNADIIINESAFSSIDYTKDETDSSYLKAYLGDVFTHELGHFLGLSHSEVVGSSMVYSVFKNQHTIHSDDYSGVLDNYNKTLYAGSFNGTVKGGTGTAVFGAHVLMLSTEDGKVVQSTITDEDGTFTFKNVPLDKTFYFYVTPFKQIETISGYYSTIVNSYCDGQQNYRGAFYTKCGPRSKSRPQVFSLSSTTTSQDLGTLTIRCDENLDSSYLGFKNETTNRSYELNPLLTDFNQIFVGMFTANEISQGLLGMGDEYTLDLRSLDFGSQLPQAYKLKLDLLSTGLGSAFDFEVQVQRDGQPTYTTYVSSVDETGKTITDFTIDLDLSVASDNLFSIKVLPKSLSTLELYEIFSITSNLSNPISLYTLSTQVGTYSNGVFVPFESYTVDANDDNSVCMEGNISFQTQAYTPLSIGHGAPQPEPDQSLVSSVSCATINLDDSSGPGPGGMSFVIGLFLMLGLLNLKQFKAE